MRYRTRDGARVTERARLVVGADGRNSFLARALALPKYDELALCFKDQCTAIGMTHAFRDAELAATALDGWLSGQEPIDVALKRYEHRRRSQTAAVFIAAFGDIAPVSEFFDPSNLFLLSDTARQSSHEHAVFDNFEDTYRSYRQNPFAQTTA